MNRYIHTIKFAFSIFLMLASAVVGYSQKSQPGMVSEPFNYSWFSKATDTEKGLPYNAPCSDCVEDIAARTETTRSFKGEGGLVYSQAGYTPINIKNASGKWIPVDARLKPEGNGIFAARDQYYPTEIDLSKGSAISNLYGEIRFNNKPELLWKMADGSVQSFGKANFSQYSAGNDGMKITNVWPGIDMEMRMLLGGIKTNFIVKEKPQQTDGHFIIRDEIVISDGLNIKLDANEGTVETASGEEAFHISACIGYDSKRYRENGVQHFSYALQGNTLDMVIPLADLHAPELAYPYTIDPLVNSSNTIPQAPMNGSGFGATCFSNFCNYSMNVATPANTGIIDVLWSFNYVATGGCVRDDGALSFTSGTCASPPVAGLYWLCELPTAGNCNGNNVSILSHISNCMPAPSCTPQIVPFSMRFYRCFDNTGGCSNTCIGAASPWTMTIVGRTVEVASVTVNNTNTVTVCQGTPVNLNGLGAFGIGPYTYAWNPGNISGTSATVSPNTTQIYTLTVTDACSQTRTANLTVNVTPTPTTPVITSNSPVCVGQTLNLNTSSTGNYFWTGPAGFSSNVQNPSIPSVTTARAGTYNLFVVQSGCTSLVATHPVVVNPIPAAPTANSNSPVCAGNAINLTASGGSSFVWTGPNTFSSTLQNPVINNAAAVHSGTYSVAAIANGCTSAVANRTVVVNPLPATPIINSNSPVCENGALNFSTTSAGNYFWNGPDGFLSNIQNPTINGMDPSQSGNYNLFIVQNGCTSATATLPIVIHPRPSVNNIPPQVICQGTGSALVIPSGTAGATFTWINNNPSIGLGASGIGNIPVFTPTISGSATITVTPTANGCAGTATNFSITVNPAPTVTAINNKFFCEGETTNVIPVTGPISGTTFTWTSSNANIGLATSGSNNIPAFTPTNPGNTTISSTIQITPSSNGCPGVPLSFTISVNPTFTGIENASICLGDSHVFGGQSFTTAGSFPITFQTVNGCDSIVTLNLTVNPTQNGTENATICNGDVFSFGGQQFSTPGNFPATFTNANGCDSVVTLVLTVNTVLTSTENVSICNGETYVLGGQTFTTGGNHTVTFQSLNGCDSIVTLNLTLNPTFNGAENITICNSETHVFGGQNFTAAGNFPVTFQTIHGCDSVVTLNLTVNPIFNGAENITICNGETHTFGGQQFTTAGSFPVTFQTVNGCDSTVTLNLTVNPTQTGAENATICNGDIFTFGGQQFTTAGNFPVTFSNTNGCDSVVTLNLTVNTVLTSTENISICNGATYVLDNQTFTSAGIHTVTFQSLNGCDSIVTLNLSVNPIFNGAENITICNGETHTFGGQNFTTAGSFPVTFQTINGCDSIVTLNLTVNPIFNGTENITICNGETHTFGGQQFTTAGSFPITFQTFNGCDSIVTLNLTVNPTQNGTENATICNGDVFTFGGQQFSTPGNFLVTFSNVNGCDSVVTLILLVNTVLTSTENISICNGETYTLGGQNFIAPGSFPITFQSLIGCDSIVTLNLTVNPTFNGTENITICNGETHIFGGQNFATAGSFPVTFQTINGCDSIVMLNLTVNPIFNGTENITICNGETHIFGGQTFTAAGNFPITFQTVNGCDSIVTLNLTVNPTQLGTENATICNGDVFTFGGQQFTNAGNFPVTFTNTNGCDSVVTLNLTVNTVLTSTENISICNGETYTLGGQNFTAPGSFPITFQSLNGCDSIVTLNLTVNPIFNGNENITICNGETHVFGGQSFTTAGSFPVTFQTVNGCDSIITLNLTVNPTFTSSFQQSICPGASVIFNGIVHNTAGNFTETFQTINGCDSTVTLVLTVTPISAATINPQADQCLQGNSFDFSLSQNLSPNAFFTWTFTGANTNSSNLQNPTGISYPSAGQYTVGVEVNENGCESQGTITINVLTQPIAQFNALPPSGCTPFKVEYTDISIGNGGNITWNFAGGNPPSSNTSPVTVVYNTPGQYDVSLTRTLANGCSDTETVQNLINAQPLPTAGFSIEPSEINITNPMATFIDASSGSSEVLYFIGDGSPVFGPDAQHVFDAEGRYDVMQIVVSAAGCADTAYGSLTVIGNTEIFIPNTFTPNSDPINPGFRVVGNGFTDFHMTIFNRWGEILFETRDENNVWDGTHQGKLMPMGVYAYKIEARDFRKTLKSYIGHVNLLR